MATTTPTSKARTVFGPTQCHHRDADGQPDCRAKRAKPHQNLCPRHEAIWQKAARERATARRAEVAKVAMPPKASVEPIDIAASPPPSSRRRRRPSAQRSAR